MFEYTCQVYVCVNKNKLTAEHMGRCATAAMEQTNKATASYSAQTGATSLRKSGEGWEGWEANTSQSGWVGKALTVSLKVQQANTGRIESSK